MTRILLALLWALCLAGAASGADSAGWRKPYFGATVPGSWAQYTMRTEGQPDMTYVSRRLPDDASGRERVQTRVEYLLAGKLTAAITEYTLKPGYALAEDALGFGKAMVAMSTATGGTKPVAASAAILAGTRRTMPDYAPTAQFVGTENVGGKVSDHYRYTQRYALTPVQIETGDIWLNDTVPFGMVKQQAVTRDESGKLVSRFEMLLADSGVTPGAAAPAVAPAPSASPAGPVPLADAFRAGSVELAVYVVPGTGDGRTLRIAIRNRTESPLRVTIPAGAIDLDAGDPLQTLRLKSAARRTLAVAPGAVAKPVDLAQVGTRRAIDGTFRLWVQDGKPEFRGSVTTGTVAP